MHEYVVEIKEVLEYKETVKAKSKEDAMKIVKEKYNNEEIILDSDNYVSTEFNVSKTQKEHNQYER